MSNYGYTDEGINDNSNSLKFGLNQNVFLKEFSYNTEDDSKYLKLIIECLCYCLYFFIILRLFYNF